MDQIVYQSQDRACGYACVKMALIHYGRNRHYANLPEPSTAKGTPSLAEIVDFAKTQGLSMGVYKAEKPSDLAANTSFPLLLVLNEEGASHMVYLTGYQSQHFLVYDPSKGKRRIKRSEMDEVFTGVFLECKKSEIKEYRQKEPKIVPHLSHFVQAAFQLSAFSSLFTGFYFVSDDGNYIAPVILFTCFALLSVAQRFFSVRTMKRFDDRYLHNVERLSLSKREEAYRHYTSFKTAIFSGAPAIFGGALEIAALSLLLGLNEPWVGLSILIVFALLIVERVFIKPILADKERRLESIERGFMGHYWPKNKNRPRGEEVMKEAYKIADYLTYRRFLLFAAELVLSLVCVLLSGRVSLNFMLFSLVGIALLGEEFDKILTFLEQKRSFEKEKAYFVGHFLNHP